MALYKTQNCHFASAISDRASRVHLIDLAFINDRSDAVNTNVYYLMRLDPLLLVATELWGPIFKKLFISTPKMMAVSGTRTANDSG